MPVTEPTRDRLIHLDEVETPRPLRRPDWLKVRAPSGETYEWLQGLMDQAIEELQQASHAMAQHLYGQGQGGGPGGGAGGPAGGPGAGGAGPSGDGQGAGKEDVIDAEFEVKK